MLTKAGLEALIKYRGLTPEEVVQKEGLEIREAKYLRSVDDIIISNIIILPKDLMPLEKRWRIAHCLGHYFMHSGNQFYSKLKDLSWDQQELQANVFAACLLAGMSCENIRIRR